MTNPTGASFLSYKRERSKEAKLVVEAFRDHGIPSWQDVHDLANGTTETELEKVLGDENTASAVLLVTPEVESSDIIRETEAPLVFRRHSAKDEFFAMPVAAGGLGYEEVSRVLGPRIGLLDVSGFNIRKAPTDPFDADFAAVLAGIALDHRLRAINGWLADGEEIKIQVSTRVPLAKDPGYALRLDLCHRFDGRLARRSAWEKHILPGLATIVKTLRVRAPSRDIVLSGYPAIPAAVALGAAFLSLGGMKVSWLQESPNFSRAAEAWGLHKGDANSGFEVHVEPLKPSGTDIALLVSATTDVIDDFKRSAVALPLRAAVHVAPPSPRPARVELGAGEARQLACLAVDALKEAWTKYGRRGSVHLFLAAPAGVAFMIGQQLNTFGLVQTYEHVPTADPPYAPAALLRPSLYRVKYCLALEVDAHRKKRITLANAGLKCMFLTSSNALFR